MNIIYIGYLSYIYVLLFFQVIRLLFLGVCWSSYIFPMQLFTDNIYFYYRYINFEQHNNDFYLKTHFGIVLIMSIIALFLYARVRDKDKKENMLNTQISNYINLLSIWIVALSALQGCNFMISSLYHMRIDFNYANIFTQYGEFHRVAIRVFTMSVSGHFLAVYSLFKIYMFCKITKTKNKHKKITE